jgi:hypothetical protein
MRELTIQQLRKYLSAIEKRLWPSDYVIDEKTLNFYTFKPFPKHLKQHETRKWSELQAKTCSPFRDGDCYKYSSTKGIHLWFSSHKLKGLPETASQQILDNGRHSVEGKNYLYQQEWADGLMLSCTTKLNDKNCAEECNIHIDPSGDWAVKSKLKSQLKSPMFWAHSQFFVLVCLLTWFTVSKITISFQKDFFESKNSVLSTKLKSKLDTQNSLSKKQNAIQFIQKWQSTNGFFPESLAIIVHELSKQGTWTANILIWQDKTIELEFEADNLNITDLISSLESNQKLGSVNIRPFNSSNTWILEARVL